MAPSASSSKRKSAKGKKKALREKHEAGPQMANEEDRAPTDVPTTVVEAASVKPAVGVSTEMESKAAVSVQVATAADVTPAVMEGMQGEVKAEASTPGSASDIEKVLDPSSVEDGGQSVRNVDEDVPGQTNVLANGEGILTSFEWSASDAEQVLLAGSFNDWKKKLVMQKRETKFYLEIPVKPGKHFYKFIVDGVWCFDIRTSNEPDSGGNINNTVIVAKK